MRDNTLESAESRANKVKSIVEDFVLDSGANQLGLAMNVKGKLKELYANVNADSDFWDGRPLLMLQREAELMLLPDVREYAEVHPWVAEDGVIDDHGGLNEVTHVSSLLKGDDARRTELLKKMQQSGASLNKLRPGGKMSTLKLHFNRLSQKSPRSNASTADLSPAMHSTSPQNGGKEEEVRDLTVESRYCRLSKYELLVYSGAVSPADDHSSHVEWELSLIGLTLAVHPAMNTLELTGQVDDHIIFLQFDSATMLKKWQQALEGILERMHNHMALVGEKRQKILSLSSKPPPPKRPSISAMLKEEQSREKLQSANDASLATVVLEKEPRKKKSTPKLLGQQQNVSDSSGDRVFGSMSNMSVDPPMTSAPRELQAAYGVSLASLNLGYGMSIPEAMLNNYNDDGGPVMSGYGGPLGACADVKTDNNEDSSESSSCSLEKIADDDTEYDSSRRDDFNEIFQTCVTRLRELDHLPPSHNVSKQRTDTYVELIGLAEDFVTSAKRYGQIIISEVYLPLSKKTLRPDSTVGGVIGGDKYIVHNIMFKFAIDSAGVFGGNDESAAKVAGLELKGLQAYMSSNTPDLCYPLMALIDYKGFRLVASSFLPLTHSSLHYGSQNAAVTIKKSLPALTRRIEEASASLNLKLHEAGRDRVVMATAVDIEGHLGKDNRMYLLDFSRVFPPVTPNRTVEGSHLFQMFRPEFVKSFTLFPLCSDAYSNFTAGLPHAREHAEEVDLASMELLNVSVSNFVAELIARMGEEARIAGSLENFALTQLLHSHGINVRYLGEVVRKMGRHPFGLVVLAQLVARVIKIGFRRTLRSEMARLRVCIDEPYRIAAKDFLNRVFSASEASEKYWAEDLPELLNERFQLRPGNWNVFPKNLKKTLFEVERVNGIMYNAKVAIFREVQAALGLKVAPSLLTLLQTQPIVYQQQSVFDDVDVEDVGLRVKFLDVISNAQGYVFSKRAAEKEKEGFYEAAKSLYYRAYMGYQAALGSCPNDSILLRNCALVMTKIYRLEIVAEGNPDHEFLLRDADPDDPLLFSAQQNFKKAIQANRKSPVFYASYADFLSEMGHLGDSEAHYLEALLRDPYAISTLNTYAKLLDTMKQSETAERFRDRARAVEAHIKAAPDVGSSERLERLISLNRLKVSSDLSEEAQKFL